MTKKLRLGCSFQGEEDGKKVNNLLEMNSGEGANDGFSGPGPNDSLLPGLIDDVALNCLAWVSGSDYAALSCINKRFNKLINSGYLYGLRKQLGAVEHLVYMVCDPRGWVAFDPKINRWISLPKIPCDECFNHADKESLAVGCELLVFGRELMEFAIWKYSMICRGWVKCQEMNQPRCLFGSSSLGSIAIVAGGSDKYGNVQ